MSDQLNARPRIALERTVTRLSTRRRIMRNSWIASIAAWLAIWIGFAYFFGDRYPALAEWSFLLGAVAGVVTMAVAVQVQIALDGRV